VVDDGNWPRISRVFILFFYFFGAASDMTLGLRTMSTKQLWDLGDAALCSQGIRADLELEMRR